MEDVADGCRCIPGAVPRHRHRRRGLRGRRRHRRSGRRHDLHDGRQDDHYACGNDHNDRDADDDRDAHHYDHDDASATAASGPDVEIASYSGSGSQSMRPFTVEDGWEVQWDFTGDILQIYINDESGGMGGIAANQQGSGSGSSYQGRGGTFYVETNAIGDWTIRIVDVP